MAVIDSNSFALSGYSTRDQSITVGLLIGICVLAGCSCAMLIVLAVVMRAHTRSMLAVRTELDQKMMTHKLEKRERDADLRQRWEKVCDEMRGEPASPPYVADPSAVRGTQMVVEEC